MGTTQGFELVAEVRQDFLLQVLQAAWDSSVIPHSTPIAPGLAFGPYQVASGTVNIARAGLAVSMVPPQNAVQLLLPSHIQVTIANPPIPSASMFDMLANISATLPVGTEPNTKNVGLIVDALPPNNVSATLTSGDPIGPITLAAIKQYVDTLYQNGTIPNTITKNGVVFGAYKADTFTKVSDDPTDATNQIDIIKSSPNQVQISIPIYLKLTNVTSTVGPAPLAPIGVTTRIDLIFDLLVVPGSITATLNPGTPPVVEPLSPAPGVEGTNYTFDNIASGGLLATVLTGQIQSNAQNIASAIGTIKIVVPTQSQIEAFIANQAFQTLVANGDIGVWEPQSGNNPNLTINDATPQVLSDAIAIGINAGPGANASQLTNFIPAASEFALAIDSAKVLSVVQQTIDKPQSAGGLGGVPDTLTNVDGHTVKLNSLTPSLQEGSIHFEGNVTVVNAIAGHIDVSADFHADAGMTWVNNSDGTQMIQGTNLGSGVSLGVLAWIISLILGWVTGGIFGLVIAVVVLEVVQNIASDVGASVAQDDITKQVQGIGAWPQTLNRIGTVTASFQNPIDIHSDCVIFSG